jgi:uncharacterized protein YecE (DUF72 family)
MINPMTVYIGTSGWQYKHWLERFYPRKPRVSDELAFYAERFQTVEANGTFYRLPEASTFEDWSRRTPGDFVFAMKASRFLTHIKRLKEPRGAVERMMERASKLGGKIGPVLLQLPPDFRCDIGRLDDALAAFGEFAPGVRLAVEFRHDSWFVDNVRRVLEQRNAAFCIADRRSRLITPAWRTADWGYWRFHEGRASPRPCYGRSSLTARAETMRDLFGPDSDVYAYFNNDPLACALRDAGVFARACERAGLCPARTAPTDEIAAG